MTTLLLDCTHGSTKSGFAQAVRSLVPEPRELLPILDYVPQETVGSAACFRLPDCKSLFWIVRDSQQLAFNFTVDWATVDRDIAVSYGREPTDADLMQKR